MSKLYVAFKRNGNSSNKIVRSLSGDNMDFNSIAMKLNKSGIITNIGNTPTQSLCNEAYWYMLKKFNCHVVFFHVPSIKYITENFIEKVKTVL